MLHAASRTIAFLVVLLDLESASSRVPQVPFRHTIFFDDRASNIKAAQQLGCGAARRVGASERSGVTSHDVIEAVKLLKQLSGSSALMGSWLQKTSKR